MERLSEKRSWLAFGVLLVAYTVTASVGLTWARISGAASPVWPAAGIGIAGLLLGGLRNWPAILLGRVAAGLITGSALPLWGELAIGAGNAAAALVAVVFLRSFPIDVSFRDVRSTLRFAMAAALAAVTAAIAGTLVLDFTSGFGDYNLGGVFLYWLVGAFTGALLFAPVILTWWVEPAVERPVHLAASLLIVMLLCWLFFAPGHEQWFRFWHVIPVLVWISLTHDTRGAAMASVIVAAIALWAAGAGSHAFADSSSSLNDLLPLLQQFVAVAAMTTLLLASANAERQREGAERYRLALDAARQGMFEFEGGTSLMTLDPQSQRLLRLPLQPSAVAIADAFMGVAEKARSGIVSAFQEAGEFPPGHTVSAEVRIDDPGAPPRWLAIHGRSFRKHISRDRRAVNVRGTIRDITDQKIAELRAEESEQFARRVLDNMTAFVGILTPDGTLVEANEAPLKAADLSSQDVIGRKFWDCPWWSYAPRVQDDLKAAVARALKGEIVRYDVPVRISGGELLWIDFQLAPLRDENGIVTHLIPSGIDISARKQMEERKRMLIAILEQSPDIIATIDETGHGTYINPGARHLLNLPADLPTGEITLDLMHPPATAELLRTTALPIAEEEGVWRGETEVAAASGARIPVSQVVVWHKGEEGRPSYFSTIMRDIREERKAREHEKLLLRELSHRVKNTLAIVQSIVRQTLRLTSDPKRFADMVEGRVSSLGTSHALLTASNWHGARIEELLRSQLHPFVSGLDHRLMLEGDDVVVPSETATKLGLIIHELGTNAIKYGALASPTGRIRIVWKTAGGMLRVEWVERGGPPVTPASKKGFGSSLIDISARRVERAYDPEGLTIRFSFPLPAGDNAMLQ